MKDSFFMALAATLWLCFLAAVLLGIIAASAAAQ